MSSFLRSRRLPIAVLIVGVIALARPLPCVASDKPAEIIAATVAAHGGRALLEAPPPLVLRGRIRVRLGGSEVAGSLSLYRHEGKERRESSMVVRGAERDFVSTWDGHDAWAEAFGRKSERSRRPIESELRHLPEAALLRALKEGAELVQREALEPGILALRPLGEPGTELGIDRATHLLRYVSYTYPHQSGIDEIKDAARRDTYTAWEPVDGGLLVARHVTVEIDGIVEQTLEFDSVETPGELDPALFRLERDSAPQVPSDELAD